MKREIIQMSVIMVLMTGLVAGCIKIGYNQGIQSVKLPECRHVMLINIYPALNFLLYAFQFI